MRADFFFSHKGDYDVILFSMSERLPAIDRLTQTWQLVGDDVCAVLVGEELEVDESQISALLQSRVMPSSLDLCDAAVVRGDQSMRVGQDQKEIFQGGRLVIPSLGR